MKVETRSVGHSMLCNADGVGGVTFFGKICYEHVRFNVISVTRGWVGVQFPEEEKRYVTLEWPHSLFYIINTIYALTS